MDHDMLGILILLAAVLLYIEEVIKDRSRRREDVALRLMDRCRCPLCGGTGSWKTVEPEPCSSCRGKGYKSI